MTSELLEIINRILDDSGRERLRGLSPELRLKEDIGLDSLELAVLAVHVEAEFGIDVFADGLLWTVGEIQAKLKEGARPN